MTITVVILAMGRQQGITAIVVLASTATSSCKRRNGVLVTASFNLMAVLE
jgi:hypothetical protein